MKKNCTPVHTRKNIRKQAPLLFVGYFFGSSRPGETFARRVCSALPHTRGLLDSRKKNIHAKTMGLRRKIQKKPQRNWSPPLLTLMLNPETTHLRQRKKIML